MEIIRRDFMTAPLWGAKDPRLCRLLPVWLGMLDELGVPVRGICVLRHPAEVAESLALRNGFSADKSGLLWLRYVLEAERHSRWMSWITIRYGDLLRDSRAESQRIAQALGIVWPKPHDEAADDATDFLERGLRHHESVYFDRFPPPLRRWIVSAYRALSREAARASMDLRSSTACTASWRHTIRTSRRAGSADKKHRSRKRANPRHADPTSSTI